MTFATISLIDEAKGTLTFEVTKVTDGEIETR